MIIKNHFHKKGFALGLVLNQRLPASRKWPIVQVIITKIAFSLMFLFCLISSSKTSRNRAVAISGN